MSTADAAPGECAGRSVVVSPLGPRGAANGEAQIGDERPGRVLGSGGEDQQPGAADDEEGEALAGDAVDAIDAAESQWQTTVMSDSGRPTFGREFSLWQRETLHGLPCRVLLPRGYDPRRRYPLVLSLHGSGERGDDNERQLHNGLAAFTEAAWLRAHEAIVVAPQIPGGQTFGGSWYGGAAPAQQTVVDIVNDLASRASVDEDRVYAVGYSMGAIGLWDLLVRFPGVFAAAIAIAGDLDVDAAPALQGFPLWAVHGADDTLVRPDNTRRIDEILTEPFRYTELRGVGHGAWAPAFSEPALWTWLFSHRRR